MALINLRNALMSGKRTPTAKDYVQNGLIAMWDGIENAGWGTHDTNNRLANLVSGGLFGDISGGTIAQNHLYTTAQLTSTVASTLSDYMTVEFCVDYTNSARTSSSIFVFPAISSTSSSVGAYSWNSNTPLRMFRSVSWITLEPTITDDRLFNTLVIAFRKASGQTSSQMLYSFGFSGEYKYTRQDSDWVAGYAVADTGRFTVGNSGLPMKIHAARIYSRALTASEIAANYAIDKDRFGLP